MGVSAEHLRAIGAVTVAVGRIEWAAGKILLDLGRDPKRAGLSQVLKEIRSAVQAGLPPQSQLAPEAVSAWVERTLSAVNERNRVIHAATVQQVKGGQAVPYRLTNRDGHGQLVKVDHVLRLARRLADCEREALLILIALRGTSGPRLGPPNFIVVDGEVKLSNDDPDFGAWWEGQTGRVTPAADLRRRRVRAVWRVLRKC